MPGTDSRLIPRWFTFISNHQSMMKNTPIQLSSIAVQIWTPVKNGLYLPNDTELESLTNWDGFEIELPFRIDMVFEVTLPTAPGIVQSSTEGTAVLETELHHLHLHLLPWLIGFMPFGLHWWTPALLGFLHTKIGIKRISIDLGRLKTSRIRVAPGLG